MFDELPEVVLLSILQHLGAWKDLARIAVCVKACCWGIRTCHAAHTHTPDRPTPGCQQAGTRTLHPAASGTVYTAMGTA